ncbi:MAG: type II toxin-antitoxin system HicB family antitoxin [Betaproteobacteria bacterium]|nr:type II toxin-antitoxin system HicB family antitoxin [Betaproteobacteria bacterium]
MNMSYPVTLKNYRGGQVGVFFADVPEAISAGANQAEALDRAQDALTVALSGYIEDGRRLPVPGKAKRGQPTVVLPPRVAIKLAVHAAMGEQGITQARLGELLGIDGRQVRRILDLDHESKLSQLEAALAALGLRASVSVTKASSAATSIAV